MGEKTALTRRAVLALALPAFALHAAAQPGEREALARPAVKVRNPERAVLLGVAFAGQRLVAVGERGLVVVSDDRGASWSQVGTPVSVSLTAVRFADAQHGAAVGHGGVALTTADGGLTWTQRLDGRRAAALVLEAARAAQDAGAIANAQRLVAEGPDKPFLDVQMLDAQRIRVVGAYGLALASDDGGQRWSSWMDRLDNPKGLHCYALRERGDVVLIAGEQGLLLRSENGGRSFRRLETPYRGSFFTAELPGEHEIVVAGLRGNAWRSGDDGRSWSQLASPTAATITASTVLPDGALVFSDQAGFLLKALDDRLDPINKTPLAPVAGVIRTDDRRLLALTLQGVALVTVRQFPSKPS